LVDAIEEEKELEQVDTHINPVLPEEEQEQEDVSGLGICTSNDVNIPPIERSSTCKVI